VSVHRERDPRAPLRLFIALRLSAAAATALGEVAAELRAALGARGARASWARPTGYHVTLAFLGSSPPEAVLTLRDRIAPALVGVRRFELVTAGLGCFPDAARARVLWVGVDDADGRVADLAARVERESRALGYRLEQRRFHAHVTLARLRRPSDLAWVLSEGAERLRSSTSVGALELLDSSEINSFSGYRTVATWPF
jgi:2'-5' RNA ligase